MRKFKKSNKFIAGAIIVATACIAPITLGAMSVTPGHSHGIALATNHKASALLNQQASNNSKIIGFTKSKYFSGDIRKIFTIFDQQTNQNNIVVITTANNITNAYSIYYSTDNGKSFQQVQSYKSQELNLLAVNGIFQASDGTIYIPGRNNVYATSDGINYKAIPINTGMISDISFAGEANGNIYIGYNKLGIKPLSVSSGVAVLVKGTNQFQNVNITGSKLKWESIVSSVYYQNNTYYIFSDTGYVFTSSDGIKFDRTAFEPSQARDISNTQTFFSHGVIYKYLDGNLTVSTDKGATFKPETIFNQTKTSIESNSSIVQTTNGDLYILVRTTTPDTLGNKVINQILYTTDGTTFHTIDRYSNPKIPAISWDEPTLYREQQITSIQSTGNQVYINVTDQHDDSAIFNITGGQVVDIKAFHVYSGTAPTGLSKNTVFETNNKYFIQASSFNLYSSNDGINFNKVATPDFEIMAHTSYDSNLFFGTAHSFYRSETMANAVQIQTNAVKVSGNIQYYNHAQLKNGIKISTDNLIASYKVTDSNNNTVESGKGGGIINLANAKVDFAKDQTLTLTVTAKDGTTQNYDFVIKSVVDFSTNQIHVTDNYTPYKAMIIDNTQYTNDTISKYGSLNVYAAVQKDSNSDGALTISGQDLSETDSYYQAITVENSGTNNLKTISVGKTKTHFGNSLSIANHGSYLVTIKDIYGNKKQAFVEFGSSKRAIINVTTSDTKLLQELKDKNIDLNTTLLNSKDINALTAFVQNYDVVVKNITTEQWTTLGLGFDQNKFLTSSYAKKLPNLIINQDTFNSLPSLFSNFITKGKNLEQQITDSIVTDIKGFTSDQLNTGLNNVQSASKLDKVTENTVKDSKSLNEYSTFVNKYSAMMNNEIKNLDTIVKTATDNYAKFTFNTTNFKNEILAGKYNTGFEWTANMNVNKAFTQHFNQSGLTTDVTNAALSAFKQEYGKTPDQMTETTTPSWSWTSIIIVAGSAGIIALGTLIAAAILIKSKSQKRRYQKGSTFKPGLLGHSKK